MTTNDDELARSLDRYRNHGASMAEEVRHRGPKPYELPDFTVFGFNFRMTDIQAAIATVQLTKLDQFIAHREQLADVYDAGLQNLPWLAAPERPANCRHALQSYVVYVDPVRAPRSRNDLLGHLQSRGIAGRPGTHSVVGLEVYRRVFGTRPEAFPVATALEAHTMALPLHNHMNTDDVERVLDALAEVA